MVTPRLPERLNLAHLPTPVERLPRLSAELGVTLLVKRDDLTGMPLSGNKIRKLEYVLAEARRQDATDLLTTGGVQSNHCRATAVAARRLGLEPHLLLRTPDGKAPAEVDGNQLLDWLVGADMRYCTPSEYATRDIQLARWADELTSQGKRPYVIPEGASNAVGALGYAACVEELKAQLAAGQIPGGKAPDFVVHACGSGGTAAGLAAGLATAGLGPEGHVTRLITYAVCDDEAYFREKVGGILEDLAGGYLPALDPAAASFEVVDAWKGVGYALSTPEELRFLRDVARREALLLDPVYTGKAMAGLVDLVRKGVFERGQTVVFWHTGGVPALQAYRKWFAGDTAPPT